jgi:hypothetical protein
VARTCRSCGAPLPPDLRWCERCFAPVTLYSPRERLHEPGTFVGSLTPRVRTSRWRAGPTSFGPLGRIVSTLVLAAIFPWWGVADLNPLALWALMGWLIAASIFLRSIWKPERIVDDRPTWADRFRSRHPVLGGELRPGGTAAVAAGVLVAGSAVAGWLSLDGPGRYLWAVIVIVAGVGFLVAKWNDL